MDMMALPDTFKIKTSHYVIAGLSLVVALSWNETVKAVIKKIYTVDQNVLIASLLYSLVITAVLVLVIHLLPDTKGELPPATQQKIEAAEHKERITDLNRKLTRLALANKKLANVILSQ